MTIQDYYNEVDKAYGELSPGGLENRLRELSDAAAAEYGESSAVAASVLSELGSFYRGQGRYAESAEVLSAVLGKLGKAIGTDVPDYATALNNLAGTHRLMKEYDKAAAGFTEAMEIYRHTVGETHILYAAALNNLSLLCFDKNDVPGAADFLAKASDILAQLPECVDEFATSLCNLAVLDRKYGRQAEAIARVTRAVALYESELGTDTPHYHSALQTLGLCRGDLGDYAGAIDALQRAAEAAKQLYGESHHEYRAIMQRLNETIERSKRL